MDNFIPNNPKSNVINSKVGLIFLGFIIVFIIIFLYALFAVDEKNNPTRKPEETIGNIEPAGEEELGIKQLYDEQKKLDYDEEALNFDDKHLLRQGSSAGVYSNEREGLIAINNAEDPRLQNAARALAAPIAVEGFGNRSAGITNNANTEYNYPSPLSPDIHKAFNHLDREEDFSKQKRKEEFLKQAANDVNNNYLQSGRVQPISEYEVKAGHLIPAVMITGINSDLPGQIIAQVRENVFDTKSGQYLLIPQGSKLIGSYDSVIAYGQERALVVWNRVIFPDASSVDLKAMPGTDNMGFAGLSDMVDNHYMKLFGTATLISFITAGAQLSQPQEATRDGGAPTIGQTMAANLGQQLGQTGLAVAQKNINIQPTIKIREGFLFNVVVTKDIVFQETYSN